MQDFFLYIRSLGTPKRLARPLCVGLDTRCEVGYGQRGCDRKDRPHGIFQFTMAGEGLFRDATGTHRVGPGRGFLCESHDPEVAYCYPEGSNGAWQFVFIDFAGQVAHTMTHELIRHFGSLYDLPLDHPIIERLLAFHVHDEIGCALSPLEGSRLVTDMLHALLASKDLARNTHPDHHVVRKAHDYIQMNMANRITVGDIAQHVGMSREHFTRVFTLHAGTSPYHYILTSKIEAACNLLRQGTLTCKEVSARLGFDHITHFTRSFKRLTGCTPGDFRHTRIAVEGTRLHPS